MCSIRYLYYMCSGMFIKTKLHPKLMQTLHKGAHAYYQFLLLPISTYNIGWQWGYLYWFSICGNSDGISSSSTMYPLGMMRILVFCSVASNKWNSVNKSCSLEKARTRPFILLLGHLDICWQNQQVQLLHQWFLQFSQILWQIFSDARHFFSYWSLLMTLGHRLCRSTMCPCHNSTKLVILENLICLHYEIKW